MLLLTVTNIVTLSPVSRLPASVLGRIKSRLSFQNPAYLEAEKRGFYTGNIPREIRGWEQEVDRLTVPRGFTAHLVEILRGAAVQYRIEDRRTTLAEVDFHFLGELHNFQQEAVLAIAARDFGVLCMPTGAGKTIAALSLAARRRQPALVVVHSRELLTQWVDQIGAFLGIPANDVGIIGGGKRRIGDKITVALVQSLYKCAHEVVPHTGNLIIDECHRAPSRTFTEAVTAFDCHYVTGLSATPWRRDGLSRLIWWYLGDKVHEVDKEALVDAGHVLEAEIIWRRTDFDSTYDPSEEYVRMLSELAQDSARNALIADDVAREAGNGGGVCLVLTDRKAHCEALAELLVERSIEVQVLTGDLSNGERARVVEALNAGHVKVLLATGQLVGEGFDCKQLSTLFLATPIRSDGRLLQYLGRVLRPAPGKGKARVFDYVDVKVGVLEHAARVRARVYSG